MESKTLSEYIIWGSIIVMFVMAIFVSVNHARRIGYYEACHDMGLNMLYNDSKPFCGNLTAINDARHAVQKEATERRLNAFQDAIKGLNVSI